MMRTSAIGMMSGTSADGIDIAWLDTDGNQWIKPGPAASYPYRETTRSAILTLVHHGWRPAEDYALLAGAIAEDHKAAFDQFLRDHKRAPPELIGFHGQTVWHDPKKRRTIQLGDSQALANACGCPTIAELRQADMANGGQGAPILPIYHTALAANLAKPVVILNIGGVSNLTYIDDDRLIAFDTGPGSAMIDDWISGHGAGRMDLNGDLAHRGTVAADRLERALTDPYFQKPAPKSLDRNSFSINMTKLNLEDGAALLAAFTAHSIARAAQMLPAKPRRWLVAGGGRRNAVIMNHLDELIDAQVGPIDDIGHDGDVIEAQGIAYLAVRSMRGLPLTYPGTTGVSSPCSGGRLFRPVGKMSGGLAPDRGKGGP